MTSGSTRKLYEGIRRPEVSKMQSAREPSTEWQEMKAKRSNTSSSVGDPLRQSSSGSYASLREQSLGSQSNWPTTFKGHCTHRDWVPCPKLYDGDLASPSILGQNSSQSFLSATKRDHPRHADSPHRDKLTHSPPRLSDRLSIYNKSVTGREAEIHSLVNPRGLPHSLGRPATTITSTPDFTVPRWPPPPNSTLWRTHGNQRNVLELNKMTPRGFPAPGGAPLQYTKAHIRNPLEKLAESSLAEVSRVSGLTDTFGLSKSKNPWTVRPARPFTHESHGRANEIFEDGIYNMSDRRDVKLAEKHFREVLKFDPDHVGALSYLGIIEQEYNQNYIAAEDLFIRALALEPNNATVLGAYAQLHQNCACNYDDAEKCYKKAIACDLFDANIHANYGIFLRCALG